jgi:hypothetical protein
MITPQSYAKRISEYDDGFPDEGRYNPPARTTAEVAQREIDIEEHIAIQLLRSNDGLYCIVDDYVKQVVNNRDFAVRLIDLPELNQWHSDACDGRIEGDEYSVRAVRISLASLILADTVVTHRLRGYHQSQQSYSLGFGVCVTTSLAAAIVEYHNRIKFALTSI